MDVIQNLLNSVWELWDSFGDIEHRRLVLGVATAIASAIAVAGLRILFNAGVRRIKRLPRMPSSASLSLLKPGDHAAGSGATDTTGEIEPRKPPHPARTNLPLQLTSFIGRENDLAQVKELLQKSRLVSFTGTGGVGKTRLALQVGEELKDACTDGVWLIALASLVDPALIPQTVAAVLELREEEGRPLLTTLISELKEKDLLLILDNCEHMIDATARVAGTLLSACPHLKIIATSRQVLGVGGETVWQVPPLSLEPNQADKDASGSEAVRLFNERAQLILPTFSVTRENAETVAQICRRLDGLPLAIELAAARVDMQSLDEINQGMDHRFRLLTEGNRTVLERHQTMRACVDWSWNLLSSKEQILLRCLFVFVGAFTLEDAKEICSDDTLTAVAVMNLIALLVRKSLVRVQTRESVARYQLLETIRYYALEKIVESGESDRISARHRDWFLRLAEEFYLETGAKKQWAKWMSLLSAEFDNLRTALEWCGKETGGTEKGIRLSGALGPFWEKQNALTEGRQWLGKFLDAPQNAADKSARARALYAAGRLAYLQGDHAQAIAFFEQGLEIKPPDPMLIAQSESNLGEAFYRLLDYPSATKHLSRAIELGKTIPDPVGVAYAQMKLANVYFDTGEFERAVASYNVSLEAFRKAGDQENTATAIGNLARVHQDRAEYDQAIEGYLEAIKLFEILDNRYSLCIVYDNLSVVYMDLGNYTQAIEYLRKDIQIAEALGNDFRLAAALGNLAECQFYLGDLTQATETISSALSLVKRVQAPHHEANIYRIRGQIWATLHKTDEARKDFETALGLLEPLNHKGRLARLYRAFGKFLLNDSSTRAKGLEYVERAQALFQSLGAVKEVEKTKTLLLEVPETIS